jgi:hypothetical protein
MIMTRAASLPCKSDESECMMVDTARAGQWRALFEDEMSVLFEGLREADECAGHP